jgi:hypothetical protein
LFLHYLALVQYGVAEIRQIVNHFQALLPGFNLDAAIQEWTDLKAYITRNDHFRACHPLAVFQRVSKEDDQCQHYQNILKIINLCSLFPLSNATCERGFSTMKRIKSDWRCRLSNDTVNILMRIEMSGPDGIADFKARDVVNRWWMSGERSRRTNIVPYGPHQ